MWSIEVIVNNAKIPKKLKSALFKIGAAEEIWDDEDEVLDEYNNLTFNSDHMEHMDYLRNNPEIIELLKKSKVKGDICFGSLEGDNANNFWGYRFDGKGNMVNLVGTLTFEPEK